MPAFTWTATAHAAVWNGLTPVFADIRHDTYTLDPEKVVSALTPQTAAIMPVNVFGCPPDYEAFGEIGKKFNLPIIYDSAHGLGSRYLDGSGGWRFVGNFGEAEIFSMSPTKVVTAMEGGLITTHNMELAQRLRQMRDYGKSPDGEDINWLGLSARVPEINAIVAYYNFSHMDELVNRRRELTGVYRKKLTGLPGVKFQVIPENRQTTWNHFTIFIDQQEARQSRDQVHQYLKEHQVQAKKYFYPALHLQRIFKELRLSYREKLPITEKAAQSCLAVPLFSHIKEDEIHYICDLILKILS